MFNKSIRSGNSIDTTSQVDSVVNLKTDQEEDWESLGQRDLEKYKELQRLALTSL